MMKTVFYKLKAMTGGPLILLAMLLASLLCFMTVNGILSDTSASSIRICVIDNDGSELSRSYTAELEDTPGISVQVQDGPRAQALLQRGRVEALLYIGEGFGEAMASQEKLPLVFVSGSLGVTGEAAREILGGKALSMQSALDALARLREDFGLEGDGINGRFYDYLKLSEQSGVPVVEYVRHDTADAVEKPVFGRVFARYSGFAALVIFLFVMSLSVMLSTDSSRSVNRASRVVKGGVFTAPLTDYLALATAAFLLCITALISKLSVSASEWLAYFCYSILVSGICMLLSFTRAGGGIDMAAPLFALVTGVVGGCFFDTAALGKTFELISYFTPQGLLIGAVAGKGSCTLIMLGAGILCFLVSCLIEVKRT